MRKDNFAKLTGNKVGYIHVLPSLEAYGTFLIPEFAEREKEYESNQNNGIKFPDFNKNIAKQLQHRINNYGRVYECLKRAIEIINNGEDVDDFELGLLENTLEDTKPDVTT